MKSMQPKIGDTLWGVWEHRYYNEKRLVELEYVVYPVKITRFFKGKYVDAHCVGVDVDGHTAVHWVAVKSIGKSCFIIRLMPPNMPRRYRITMTSITLSAVHQLGEHSGSIFLRRTRHGQAQE